jgi:hypothetical protein
VADLRESVDEPLYGFRAWLAYRWTQGPRLMATTVDAAWDAAGVTEARCLFETAAPSRALQGWARHFLGRPEPAQPRHPAPAANCRCGLYAYDSLSTALAYVGSARWATFPWRPGSNNLFVLGAVLLWGTPGRPVQVGDLADGAGPGLRFRAPYARVLALLDPGRPDDTAHELGAAFGLPVLPALGLELYAREHGARLRIPGQEVTT